MPSDHMTRNQAAPYGEDFFEHLSRTTRASALAVVPHILELVPVNSVVDLGCGEGIWLHAFGDHGVTDVLGLDGDYVQRDHLQIGPDKFRPVDLTQPVQLDRSFDLALCLEVGEHLPARSARSLVRSLAAAAPVVLFSAALPGQGGVAHVNERWPIYWEHMFAAEGMRKWDVVRPRIWSDRVIEPYYRQNLYLFARDGAGRFADLPAFEPEFQLITGDVMARVTAWWNTPITRALLLVTRLRRVIQGA